MSPWQRRFRRRLRRRWRRIRRKLPHPGRWSRRRKWIVGVLSFLLILLLVLLLLLWLFLGRIERVPMPEGERPAKTEGVTFLLGGTDRRGLIATTGEDAREAPDVRGAQRTDTIMLVHFTEDRQSAYAVSIPRDTWVDLPGYGKNKVNAAYSLGGAPLFVETIENLTNVRVDHVAIVDWTGFMGFTDAVGGVDVVIPETTSDAARGGYTWERGPQHLDGTRALLYVGQRYGLPRGDFDRVRRQQNFIKLLANKLLSAGVATSPGKLGDVIETFVKHVTVDEDLGQIEMARLAFSLRDLGTEDMTFLTVPNNGTGRAGAASIVVYDEQQANELWQDFRDEDVDAIERDYSDLRLGGIVN